MDVFRVFDALNDIRNLRRAIAAVRRAGKHAQGTICYTVSPLHTTDAVRRNGGATPGAGLRFHLHQGHGRAAQAAAGLRHRQGHQGSLRRGNPRSRPRARHHRRHHGQPDEGHRSRRRLRRHGHQLPQPRTRPQPHREPGRDARRHRLTTPSLDKARLLKLKHYFNKVRPRYKEFLSNITGVETEIFDSQIPGGMISNMESQLKQQGAGDTHEGSAGRSAATSARTPAIRRWSRPPARSSARRPSST